MAAGPENLETQKHREHPRLLSEVYNLLDNRQPGGVYEENAVHQISQNIRTAVHEGGIPNAITTTTHEAELTADQTRVFKWLGKTAVENAMSGYQFHKSEAAHDRVAIEVDEAHYIENVLRPGIAKLFISPKMTRQDADSTTAKSENLADEDGVRMSWIDEDGSMKMQSLLVSDVPLQAWVSLLKSYGIKVEDTESALSVMNVHRELEIPINKRSVNVLDVVKAVMPHITDDLAAKKVQKQIVRFEEDQEVLNQKSELIAEKWLEFEFELAESLHFQEATQKIRAFIQSMQHNWNKKDLDMIENSWNGRSYDMTTDLAARLEEVKRNLLCSEASTATNNDKVLKQIDPQHRQMIQQNIEQIHQAQRLGMDYSVLEAQNNRMMAAQNITVGGGCSGSSNAGLKTFEEALLGGETHSESDWKSDPSSWKKGQCRVESCETRPGTTMVGPCSVCKSCQVVFDAGGNPQKNKPVRSGSVLDGLLALAKRPAVMGFKIG